MSGGCVAKFPLTCPSGWEARPFEFDRDAGSCLLNDIARGNPPGARYQRFYDGVCPGHLTATDVAQLARALARGSLELRLNPIPNDYGPLSLIPEFPYSDADAARGVELGRGNAGAADTCTYFGFEMSARPPSAATIANSCSEVNRAGSLSIGANLDIEFHCEIHMFPAERTRDPMCGTATCTPPWIKRVAAEAVRRRTSVVSDAAAMGASVCLNTGSTDIQCNPCTTSDKLVARMQIVRGSSCPSGSPILMRL